MSFKYKVNPKCRRSTYQQVLLNATELSNVQVVPSREPPELGSFSAQHGVEALITGSASELIQYPIFALPKLTPPKLTKRTISRDTGIPEKADSVDTPDSGEFTGEDGKPLKIKVTLDFGRFFAWLERAMWVVMLGGVAWALIIDYSKATSEICTMGDKTESYPINILPSLSRTMSSFRVGTVLWTAVVALAFVARLASNTFLHRLYENWYQDTCWNKFFLMTSFIADNLEILTLLMIPAFSLDCDPDAHRFVFLLFLGLTYTAEILQYGTRYLKRKEGIEFDRDVENYYKHILLLICLQTCFIALMIGGYFLHEYICTHFLYSIFTFGEYATVVINIRFKRDTVIFVK